MAGKSLGMISTNVVLMHGLFRVKVKLTSEVSLKLLPIAPFRITVTFLSGRAPKNSKSLLSNVKTFSRMLIASTIC